MGCLNNDRTQAVMSRTYAWRPLACLPILKGSSSTNVNKDLQTYCQCALYHNAMAPIIADVNDISSTDRHFWFTDKLVRRGRGFWHLLSIDGDSSCNDMWHWQLAHVPMPKDRAGQYRKKMAAQEGSWIQEGSWRCTCDIAAYIPRYIICCPVIPMWHS